MVADGMCVTPSVSSAVSAWESRWMVHRSR